MAAQAFVTDLDELSTLDAEPPPERPPGELGIGDRIADKYTIVGLLGSGGMGAVYLARDERLARDVAIKIGLTTSVTSLARAEREGQVLAKLTDPNVVVIYEVGEHAGRVFVAMEHVGGGTARAWLAAKPRTWRQIVELYANAGAGLAAAHAAG
ncbi:MAG TPA: protein kinase, partial [Kofleriaceae bacterium]|nr:protein kinase [Kofleriaceae bacterium]